MEKNRITVAVAAHKPYSMPTDSCYLPLHVGAALHPDVCTEFQGDDEGENISSLNDFYSELTGMYWLWKNCSSDYKGLVHYRRHFRTRDAERSHSEDRFERIAFESDFMSYFENSSCDALVPKARNYFIDTIGGHYRATLPGEQLDVCRSVLADLEPGYLNAFDEVLNGRKAHLFNMVVARAPVFNSYCAWLFPVLGELCSRLDPAQYDAFNARYPGRVSEILLDVWMKTNGINWTEISTVSPEPVDWSAKVKGFLAAKYLGKKYGCSF